MPITPAELLSIADRNSWPDTAAAWEELMIAAEGAGSALLYGVGPGLQASWAGTAAELATNKINTAGGGLIGNAGQLKQVRSLLQQFATDIQEAADELSKIVTQASAAGLTVDLWNGSVGALQTPHGFVYDEHFARNAQEQITLLMQRVNALDDNVAQELRTLRPSALLPVPPPYDGLEEREGNLLNIINEGMTARLPASPYSPAQQEQILKDPAALATMPAASSQAEAADRAAAAAFSGSPPSAASGSPPSATSATPADGSTYLGDMETWGKEMGANPAAPAPSPPQPSPPLAPESPDWTAPPGVTQAEWNVT